MKPRYTAGGNPRAAPLRQKFPHSSALLLRPFRTSPPPCTTPAVPATNILSACAEGGTYRGVPSRCILHHWRAVRGVRPPVAPLDTNRPPPQSPQPLPSVVPLPPRHQEHRDGCNPANALYDMPRHSTPYAPFNPKRPRDTHRGGHHAHCMACRVLVQNSCLVRSTEQH